MDNQKSMKKEGYCFMMAPYIIPKIMENDLKQIWLQVDEILAKFDDLSVDELLECQESIQERLEAIAALLYPYIPNNLGNQQALSPHSILCTKWANAENIS
ncbi:hypothetical protein D5F52_26460 (plasmid) [Brevibacillus laterosporus]|uniref:hypothetical protein n=1 Tax=Brevibacillus laterosporus TaxID=1465 RepID=UPI000E6B7CF0|nr:hypothetical protein [Brevibacillus laterosporus]AYB41700.1 hypothetical protein D5F52_26460 [Brevibacillus laterosporus]MBG9790529.1 hypothetical protein [Brevibacillus laterosporus]MBG9804942.1 hypothetical protein [Brevibacillus laterosporus]MED1786636.1 hypothetical protein [Brevibacillus laterosporus]MED4766143.1 hypothetical protein [Brevibacillus laterosporus]